MITPPGNNWQVGPERAWERALAQQLAHRATVRAPRAPNAELLAAGFHFNECHVKPMHGDPVFIEFIADRKLRVVMEGGNRRDGIEVGPGVRRLTLRCGLRRVRHIPLLAIAPGCGT